MHEKGGVNEKARQRRVKKAKFTGGKRGECIHAHQERPKWQANWAELAGNVTISLSFLRTGSPDDIRNATHKASEPTRY